MSLIVAAWFDTFEQAESAARALPAAGATAGGATSPPSVPPSSIRRSLSGLHDAPNGAAT